MDVVTDTLKRLIGIFLILYDCTLYNDVLYNGILDTSIVTSLHQPSLFPNSSYNAPHEYFQLNLRLWVLIGVNEEFPFSTSTTLSFTLFVELGTSCLLLLFGVQRVMFTPVTFDSAF